MNTFWIIVLALLGACQVAGMIWALRWTKTDNTGDEDMSFMWRAFLVVCWPFAWFASILGCVQ